MCARTSFATPSRIRFDVFAGTVCSSSTHTLTQVLARIYFDLHPRQGKYTHAACFWLGKRDDGAAVPSACVVCNFSAPDAATGRPALLLFSEAKTLFHEFGHLMHASLSRAAYSVFNWTWKSVEV